MTKIIAFFMVIITFFCNIFGINPPPMQEENYKSYYDVAYGRNARHRLDLLIPDGASGEEGLILIIHGGAWISGDKKYQRSQMEYYAGTLGYVTAAINYRYLSEDVSFDDILDDIELSLGKIKSLAADNGIELTKMITTGASAGGHLAMLYAYSRQDTAPVKPVAVADYCGPSDMCDPNFYNENSMPSSKNIYLYISSLITGKDITVDNVNLVQDVFSKASPINYIDENTVPTIINHGMKDDTVPYSNAVLLDAKLTEYGVPHILNPFPNSGHGLDSDRDAAVKSEEDFALYCKTYLG